MKFIGIDGGGTKTDLVLCNEHGSVLKYLQIQATNPNDIGISLCKKRLIDGINEITEEKIESINGIFAGISGGMTGNNLPLLRNVLSDFFEKKTCILINSDAVCALSCGLGKQDGCVLISGTGSIAYARKGSQIFRVGGFGYLIDRGGSGYDFGRDAIYASLCAKEGRGEKTVLTTLIENKTGELLSNLDVIYQKGKHYIASFAPMIFEAYRLGDNVAMQIVERNTEEMAAMLNTIAATLTCETCETVLTGSVFREFDILNMHMQPLLKYDFNFIFPKLPPVYGAVFEIASRLGVVVDENFSKHFEESVYVNKIETKL